MTSGLFPVPLKDTVIAGQADEEKTTMPIKGTGVQPLHATFTNNNGTITLTPGLDAGVFVNGKAITEATVLKHPDRLRLAADNYYRFIDPQVQASMTPDEVEEEDTKYDWHYIKEEAMAQLLKLFEKDDQDAAEAANRL